MHYYYFHGLVGWLGQYVSCNISEPFLCTYRLQFRVPKNQQKIDNWYFIHEINILLTLDINGHGVDGSTFGSSPSPSSLSCVDEQIHLLHTCFLLKETDTFHDGKDQQWIQWLYFSISTKSCSKYNTWDDESSSMIDNTPKVLWSQKKM